MAGVVTYAFPTVGATAPTQAKMKTNQVFTAQVNFADNDTTATVTHNWGSPLSDYGTALFPLLSWYGATLGTAGLPALSFALTNSVAVTITKVAGAGTGGTITLNLWRPWSAER